MLQFPQRVEDLQWHSGLKPSSPGHEAAALALAAAEAVQGSASGLAQQGVADWLPKEEPSAWVPLEFGAARIPTLANGHGHGHLPRELWSPTANGHATG